MDANTTIIMLTMKCMLDFEEWFLRSDYREEIAKSMNLKIADSITQAFYKLPAIMRTELIIEFADSRGYYLNALRYGTRWSAICDNVLLQKYQTRKTAIYKAIAKFNEEYNQ